MDFDRTQIRTATIVEQSLVGDGFYQKVQVFLQWWSALDRFTSKDGRGFVKCSARSMHTDHTGGEIPRTVRSLRDEGESSV